MSKVLPVTAVVRVVPSTFANPHILIANAIFRPSDAEISELEYVKYP